MPLTSMITVATEFLVGTGPTSLYDAVYLATERLKKRGNLRKALLIISDGQDDRSRHSYKELRDHLRTFDIQMMS